MSRRSQIAERVSLACSTLDARFAEHRIWGIIIAEAPGAHTRDSVEAQGARPNISCVSCCPNIGRDRSRSWWDNAQNMRIIRWRTGFAASLLFRERFFLARVSRAEL